MRLKRLFRTFLPLLLVAALLAGNAQAALLDFGPTVPEVVGSTPPNIRAGFPAWFRDTNRVPLQLCLEEVPGCLFAAVDRPDLNLPLAFPNIPDELFYYSATATIPNAIENQLLFAGVEMNFFDNGDGTYDQVGFTRVRIRISSTIPGEYTVTTPWKQYVFTVDQATIAATGGRRVINATEDIGLGPDGQFAGVVLGNVGPFGYSQGAPFVTAAGSFLGDNTPRPLVGSPNNIFRIQGPPGFGTLQTNLFAVTGKLYDLAPVPTPLTVDKATYALYNTGMQVNTYATSQALSNQTNPLAAFPLNFALTGAPTNLELTGTGLPTQTLTTNSPADGNFFSVSGLFTAPGSIPAEVTVTNTADIPPTVKTVPLVDEVVIDKAVYNPSTGALSITASSLDRVAAPVLQAFMPGMTATLGTLANGRLDVTFPVTDNSGLQPKTYPMPAGTITVASAKGGSASSPVVTFIPPPPAPAAAVTLFSTTASPQVAGAAVAFTAAASGGSGSYEYQYWLKDTSGVYTLVQPFSVSPTWNWNTTGLLAGTYTIAAQARSVGSTLPGFDAETVKDFFIIAGVGANIPATAVNITTNLASPQAAGAPVTFTGTASGGSGFYEYQFWLKDTTGVYTLVQPFSASQSWTWNTTGAVTGAYTVAVQARSTGTSPPSGFDVERTAPFNIQ